MMSALMETSPVDLQVGTTTCILSPSKVTVFPLAYPADDPSSWSDEPEETGEEEEEL